MGFTYHLYPKQTKTNAAVIETCSEVTNMVMQSQQAVRKSPFLCVLSYSGHNDGRYKLHPVGTEGFCAHWVPISLAFGCVVSLSADRLAPGQSTWCII